MSRRQVWNWLLAERLAALPARLLLAAVALAVLPQSASAADQVPFSASFVTEFRSVVEYPIAHISVTGHGYSPNMGPTRAVSTDQTVSLLTGAATATYTLTAANGDTVVVRLTFQSTTVQRAVTFEGSYTVVGGTGRFAGATGGGSIRGSATFLTETSGVGSFTLTGTISAPGSLR